MISRLLSNSCNHDTHPAADAAEKTHSITGGEVAVAASQVVGRILTQVVTKTDGSGQATGRTVLSARLPELPEFLAELLASGGPVGADRVAQLTHMALDVELVLLEPRNIELLARGAAFELASDVLLIISHDPVRANQYTAGILV